MKALFFSPLFQKRIWGGAKLRDYFGYDIPSDQTGENWAISAYPNSSSVIKNKPFNGKTLLSVWQKRPDLFGYPKENQFPLLTKVLDAHTDLSVQVHPNDDFARQYENGECGKAECWYIIDCKPGAEIVYGHYAKSKEQFMDWIKRGKWSDLLCKVTVKQGDFFYVPSGTIHAIGAGILLLETQQSSNTTYRVYDYERKDATGKKRELHLQKAAAVTTVPHHNPSAHTKVAKQKNATVTTFLACEFFNIYKYEVRGKATFSHRAPYTLVSVLEGVALLFIDGEVAKIQKGDHFLLPSTVTSFIINGHITAILSTPPQK